MERQLPARAVGPAGSDRLRHVGEADDTVVAVRVGASGRDLAPVLRSGRELDLAAEMVGVGNDERASLAVELDRTVAVETSKLMVIETAAPLANISVPVTCVATSTGTRVPASGWLVTTRSDLVRVAAPLTLATGPRRLTRSVT